MDKRHARCVSIMDSTRELAKQLGHGSVSRGIETAVHELHNGTLEQVQTARRARSVCMLESTRELAKQLGYGSVSRGIETAVHAIARERGMASESNSSVGK